jgi:serine-type D-Ala-D-Ala carboxypeptidase/endopeptidase (penicillin-binding protein 4)
MFKKWIWIFSLALVAISFLFSADHATFSFYAVKSDTGEVLQEKDSDLSIVPASCLKVVTTSTALYLLGPNYRFETHLEYDGVIDSSQILHGNLYIRGGGDPCLGSDRISGTLSWQMQIQAWADAIQKLGIKEIEGKVMGDDSKWEKALAPPSWSWEDLGNYYGAGACALSFHENSYSLFFKPGKVGDAATLLRTDPPLLGVALHNEVKTGPEGSGDQACIYGSEYSPIQFIRGTIPAAVDEFVIRGATSDPASDCAFLLSQQLQQRGITIREQNLALEGKRIAFHVTYSPTLKEIVYWTNQKSINLYAEHLLKKMGEVMYKEGTTVSGIKAVSSFWSSQGIDLEGFHMADGSGLSRKNLITTKQLVEILLRIKKSSIFPILFESLPQREGVMRAKSGSMSLVKGYLGYSGDTAFAIVVNQCPNSKLISKKIDGFLTDLNNTDPQNLKHK